MATTNVDVKQVVTAAAEYLKSLLGEIAGVRLEEIEENNKDSGWLVTLSYLPSKEEDLFVKREYKRIEVNDAGQPIAMRIRRIE